MSIWWKHGYWGTGLTNRGCRAASAICHKHPCNNRSRVCSRRPECVCEEDALKFNMIDVQEEAVVGKGPFHNGLRDRRLPATLAGTRDR